MLDTTSVIYPPLGNSSIRLLKILPGRRTEQLLCESSTISLDRQLQYSALSYKWGAETADCYIRLNGHCIPVRKNLLRFLLHARSLSSTEAFSWIWIDALCIDQSNDGERTQQVARMGEIFSRATQVIAWLGPAYDQSDLAMKLINKPLSHWRRKKNLFHVWTTPGGVAMRSFFVRNYWRRLWIYQELILAREIKVMCGDLLTTWETVRDLLLEIATCQPPNHVGDGFEFEAVRDSSAMSIVKQMTQDYSNATILEAMIATQKLRCLEIRDKVYALLSVSRTRPLEIPPDYRASIPTLLNKVLRSHHAFQPPDSLEEVSNQCRLLTGLLDVDPQLIYELSNNSQNADPPTTSGVPYHLGRAGSPITLWWASYWQHDRVAKLLLEHNAVDTLNLLPRLAEEGHEAAVKLFVDFDWVDIDNTAGTGRTPFTHAVVNGQDDVARLLLDSGRVDVDCVDETGWTPLAWAADNGHVAMVKMLLDSGTVRLDFADNTDRTPLSWAAASGHLDILRLLLESGKVDADSRDNLGRAPLSWAAGNGRATVVNSLLESNRVDINAMDNSGRTAVAWAAKNGHPDVVKRLIDSGIADLDGADGSGRTPLSWAVANGHEAICDMLISTAAVDLDTTNEGGWNLYHFAASSGNETIGRLLLRTHNRNVDHPNFWGRTPLSIAAEYGHTSIVQMLLDVPGISVDAADENDRTPLSWAAAGGHEDIVRLLLSTGRVDLESRDSGGWTPFSWSMPLEHEGDGEYLGAVRALLETEIVDVDCKDRLGRTPLSWAAQFGCVEIAKLLLQTHKVDVTHKDNSGGTPLSWARRNGHDMFVKLLQEYSEASASAMYREV